jgi:hypothetical protein
MATTSRRNSPLSHGTTALVKPYFGVQRVQLVQLKWGMYDIVANFSYPQKIKTGFRLDI